MTLKKSLAVTTAAALALSLAACTSDSDSDSNGANGDSTSGGDNYVIVNGTPVIAGGKHTGSRAGRVLRHLPRK